MKTLEQRQAEWDSEHTGLAAELNMHHYKYGRPARPSAEQDALCDALQELQKPAKLNLKQLQKTFSYLNVLVEKNEPNLNLPASVPVFKDYKIDKVIGIAQPRYLNGGILCNIFVFEDTKGLYPGICFNTHPENDLLYLSLGIEPNIDNTITQL